MRDLASVVTIETKSKMYQKDRICAVTFKENGYEAIVPVIHNVGDKMVFIQEGSILPEEPKWEFLRKRCYRDSLKGFLIAPMTMGAKDDNGEKGSKVKSWGLCVSLEEAGLDPNLKAGTDVTDSLNIRKYEPDEEDASPTKSKKPKFIQFCLNHKTLRWIGKLWLKFNIAPKTSKAFPTDVIQKSDETTIQNCKELISQFKGKEAFITCVSGDTQVYTEDGIKTIEEIVNSQYKGKVLSFNKNKNIVEYKSILNHLCLPDDENTEWYEIELENGTKLKITGEDSLYLPKLGYYKKVKDLKESDILLYEEYEDKYRR